MDVVKVSAGRHHLGPALHLPSQLVDFSRMLPAVVCQLAPLKVGVLEFAVSGRGPGMIFW
jgi:hypothetical protein